jgi:GNAT superfamily N-acetyltransferase
MMKATTTVATTDHRSPMHRAAPSVPPVSRSMPRRHRTPSGVVTIDLLQRLDPAGLVLPGGEALPDDAWLRHVRQAGEFVFVATLPDGGGRRALGILGLSIQQLDRGIGRVRRGMIDHVLVLPAYRRHGLGTQLLAAAIGFARDSGLAALREFIPAVLVRRGTADDATGWAFHTPAGEELGGLRSLGATAKACAQERQPCHAARVTGDAPRRRGVGRRRGDPDVWGSSSRCR